ncbi:MAG: hypothetical protein ACK2U9_14285 [Anaerolineae bacterium]
MPLLGLSALLLVVIVLGMVSVLSMMAAMGPGTAEVAALATSTPPAPAEPTPPAGSAETPAVAVATEPPPTATPELTETPTATASPTPTPWVTASPSPTPTATPGVNRSDLEPVRLLSPEPEITVSGSTPFVWEWSGSLASGQAFEVRIWRENMRDHLGAAAPLARPQTGRWQQNIDVARTPAMLEGGPGTYYWTVALIDATTGLQIGPEAPPQRLYYTGPRS